MQNAAYIRVRDDWRLRTRRGVDAPLGLGEREAEVIQRGGGLVWHRRVAGYGLRVEGPTARETLDPARIIRGVLERAAAHGADAIGFRY
jgi:hypothetical protein